MRNLKAKSYKTKGHKILKKSFIQVKTNVLKTPGSIFSVVIE